MYGHVPSETPTSAFGSSLTSWLLSFAPSTRLPSGVRTIAEVPNARGMVERLPHTASSGVSG